MALGLCRGALALGDLSIQQGRVSAALCPSGTICRQMARLNRRQSQHEVGPRLLVVVVDHLDDVDRGDCATTVDRRTY